MTFRSLAFVALVFVALALVPSGAHLAELLNKMALPRNEYLTVQQIYRGWALFGVVVFGALLSTLAVTINCAAFGARSASPSSLSCVLSAPR